ncbi:MAG: hypothetical protein CL910_15090 [Deltaproteobacteria bacterium]|nr:hypothetical protein [Deltaproteobacteria bacterium]
MRRCPERYPARVHHEVELRRRVRDRIETLRVELADGATLRDAARGAGLPIARACGGLSLCAHCGLQVLSGAEHLSAETPEETRAKQRNRVPAEQRLSCQARVGGPVVVTARYW